LVIYLEHDNQATNHSNLEKLNKKTKLILEKYKNNIHAPKNEISLKYKDAGNFDLLIGNSVQGRKNFIKSLTIKFNKQAFLLLLLSFFGLTIYKKTVYFYKNFRERVIWKIKLKIDIKKYPNLYKQALDITNNYKDW